MGYFNVTVKPTIAASKQHIGAFGAQDVLFDWVAFDIPRGGARCIGATLLVRPKGDETPSKNDFGVWFVVSSSDDASLGTVNSGNANRPSNDYIGILEIGDEHSYINKLNSTNIGTTGRATNNENQHPSFVVARNEGDDGNGANVGYDRFYLGGLANGAFNFESINAIAEAGAADAASTQVITMDGSNMDVREHFIAGDVLHIGTSAGTPAADSLIGTVASADSATQITLQAVSPTALVDGDILYNINPIRVILHFER
tara:strand:- start:38 stop:811 length:774 start_codon:yes stop_codon:yes gene_type:complete